MFTIGITGHRPNRLYFGWEKLLPIAFRKVFERLNTLSGSSEAPVLLTGLAAGADSAAAKAMVDIGGRVHAILPFDRQTYEEDFSESDELKTYLDLLEKSDGIEELPGRREDEPAAYEAVGQKIAARSDLLLALWDGEPGRGRGGTHDVIGMAQARNVPVLHLPLKDPYSDAYFFSGSGDISESSDEHKLITITVLQFQRIMGQKT